MMPLPLLVQALLRVSVAGLLLSLPSDARFSARRDTLPMTDMVAAMKIVQCSETEWRLSPWNIPRQDFLQFVFMMDQNVIPLYAHGQFTGYRIGGVNHCPLFKALGLRNGDIVREVNGQPIQGVFEMLKRVFQTGSSATLTIERSRKRVVFRYWFV